MSDGHLNKCKECAKRDSKKNRINNIEYYLEYDRKRSNNPDRVQARKSYQETENYRISHNKADKKYYVKNKEVYIENQKISRIENRIKHRARELVKYAVDTGKLIKPNQCEQCSNTVNIQGHHCDYTKPLEVMWLCSKCHGLWHRHNTPITE